MIPFRISFEVDAVGFFGVLETLFDVYFMVDILLCFFTGYETKGKVVLKHQEIIIKYIFSWMILDLVATFPFSWVVEEEPERFYTQRYNDDNVSPLHYNRLSLRHNF